LVSGDRVASIANTATLKEVVIIIPGLNGKLETVKTNSNRPMENGRIVD